MPASLAASQHRMGAVAPPPGLDPLTPAKVHLKDYAAPQFPARNAQQVPAVAGPAAPYLAPQLPVPAIQRPVPQLPAPQLQLPGQLPASAAEPAQGWLSTVLNAAATLDKQGLEQALEMLDRAIRNVQYTKAVGTLLMEATARQAMAAQPFPFPARQQLSAAEAWRAQAAEAFPRVPQRQMPTDAEIRRAQVRQEQQQLLARLVALRAEEAANFHAAHAAAAAAVASPSRVVSTPDFSPKQAMMAQGPLPGRRARLDVPRQEGTAKLGHRHVQTLSTSLQLLANEDAACLFIVRRINKLGFKASRKLKQHFSKFGTVERVLVAHSTVRQHGDPQCYARRRPSSLGFVHMTSAMAVAAVLELGEEQEVDGSLIRVQRFERQNTGQMAEEEFYQDAEEADNFALKMDAAAWGRQHTASTTATATSCESNDSSS